MSVQPWFPTPIYIHQLEGSELAGVQHELWPMYHNQLPGMARRSYLNESGTHRITSPDFKCNVITASGCDQFLALVLTHARQYLNTLAIDADYWAKDMAIVNSWCTLTQQGECAVLHDHGNTDISGVYYLQTTGLDGDIYFKTPNNVQSHSYLFQHIPNSQSVKPTVGQLILWPGYLEHGTMINTTATDRISISFNIQARRWYQDRLFGPKNS